MRTRYFAVAIDYDRGAILPVDVEIALDEKLRNAARVTVVAVGERTDQAEKSPERVSWHADDALIIKAEHAAQQLDMSLNDAISFLVRMGIAAGQEAGILGERALTPMTPTELFRRLAAHLLGADPNMGE